MAEERVQRRLAAILAADVVGYSRLMGEDETGTLAALKELRAGVIDPTIADHRGRMVKLMGDGALVEFASVVDAVECAVSIQKATSKRNAGIPDSKQIAFRIGINLGDIIIDGDDIYGDGVNVAARLEGEAAPGSVCISGTVLEHVRGKLDLAFEDLGERQVKNIAAPVRVYQWRDGPSVASPTVKPDRAPRFSDKPSIAVLPFNNMSNDAEQEYFADGISEDLITDLSKLEGLTVIARNSSFSFKGRQVDVKEAAQTLGVRNILEGSVRKMGDRVRINAQLIDGKTGSHIWADRYDGRYEDIFDLQDEILEKIVAALEVSLTNRDRVLTKQRATENVEAYDLFLRGRTQVYSMVPAAMKVAREHFEQAIELDDKFVAPYSFISFITFIGWLFRWPEHTGDLADAVSMAQKAVDIDPSSGMAHTWLGWAQLWTGEHDRAIATLERGIELDPTYAEGYAYLAEALNYAGDPERAVEMTRKAIENDPLLPPNCQFHLGHSYYLLGRYEEAAEAISRSMVLASFPVGHIILAAVYVEMGQMEDAAREIDILVAQAPEHSIAEIDNRYYHRPPEVKTRLLNALRKAGLPER